MPFTHPCPRCEYTIRAADTAAGTTVLCPSCRGRVELPAPTHVEPPPSNDGDWDGDEERSEKPEQPARRRFPLPLALVGGALGLLLLIGVLAAVGVFNKSKPPRPVSVPPQSQIAGPLPGPGPGPGDDELLRPTEQTAINAVAQLDTLASRSPAIPQDKARATKLRSSRLEWSHKTMDEAFNFTGQTKAPWAKQAREALALQAKEIAPHPEFAFPIQMSDATAAALAEAVRAGCDDPLVLLCHSRGFVGDGRAPFPLADARRIGKAMWESGYPDIRKAYAAHNLLVALRVGGAPGAEIATWDARFWEALGRVARDADPIVQDHVIALADYREDLALMSRGTRKTAHDEFAAALVKAGAPEYTRKVVSGAFLTHYAWDARGGGTINTVTPEGQRLFEERLTAAEADLAAAFALDATRPHAPTLMMTVCRGRGHQRPVMEEWFARAMRADPDNNRACTEKLEYLKPRWYGTVDDHLGFAWQCVRARNSDALLSLAAVSSVTSEMPFPSRLRPEFADQFESYYREPRVWQVLHTGLTTVRRDRPELTWLQAIHVRLACVGGRPDVAQPVLDAVGNHRTAGFYSLEDLEYHREWAKTGRPPPP